MDINDENFEDFDDNSNWEKALNCNCGAYEETHTKTIQVADCVCDLHWYSTFERDK